MLISLGLLAVPMVLLSLPISAGAVSTAADTGRSGAATDSKTAVMTLATQSAVVTSDAPLSLTVHVASGSPSGQMAMDVSVFSCLHTPSDFEQTLSTNPSDRLGSTGPTPLSSLASPPGSSNYRAVVGINAGDTAPSSSLNSSASAIALTPCVEGSYGGVYPVQVSLESSDGARVISHFTTFFTYSEGTAATRLRVALVLPLESPTTTTGTASAGLATPLSGAGSARFVAAVSALARSSTPSTIAPSPRTLQDAAISGRASSTAITTLGNFAQQPTVHQLLEQPYVPIDADSLAASGLSGEVTAQMQRAGEVLSGLGVNVSPLVIWIANQQVGSNAATAISAMSAHQIVLPASSLAPTRSQYTIANPFNLNVGHGQSIEAAAQDSELSRQFAAQNNDPALAAYQMIANLDLTYEETPNNLRGVVAVPPPGWQPNPEFLKVLLSSLSPTANPDLQPVTLSDFFQQVPTPSQNSSTEGPATRDLATSTGNSSSKDSSLPSSFVTSAHSDRVKWASFSSATQGAAQQIDQLNDALLISEGSGLSARARSRAVTGFQAGLDTQLSQIQLATDRTITLTSRTAALPVTILSSAPYRVSAVLSLSSGKLQFPGGSAQHVILDRSTTPVRVQVVARTSGDLPVTVDLVSPQGGLVLVHGRLTVRSTATSLVGIILTLVALAILLGWWARSSITRRRARAVARRQPS